ncbi:N-acetyllactosaminide beta-1,3-N-acetylglucosaminyltransferase 3-like isoform 3-T3 [Salvelinus alpinus]
MDGVPTTLLNNKSTRLCCIRILFPRPGVSRLVVLSLSSSLALLLLYSSMMGPQSPSALHQVFLHFRHVRSYPLLRRPRCCLHPPNSKLNPGSSHPRPNPWSLYPDSNHDLEASPILLLLAIKSHPANSDRRAAIRATWGEEREWRGQGVRRVFLLGLGRERGEEGGDPEVGEESERYGDILQWGFRESFYNVTLKEVLFWNWFHQECSTTVLYILKGDDDVYVDVERVVGFLQDRGRGEEGETLIRGGMRRGEEGETEIGGERGLKTEMKRVIGPGAGRERGTEGGAGRERGTEGGAGRERGTEGGAGRERGTEGGAGRERGTEGGAGRERGTEGGAGRERGTEGGAGRERGTEGGAGRERGTEGGAGRGTEGKAGSPQPLYMGRIFVETHPVRIWWNKYFVPYSLYTGPYPPYAGGGGYLLSRDALSLLLHASTRVPLFPIDDAYVGMVAQAANLPARHHPGFMPVEYSPSRHPCHYLNSIMVLHKLLPTDLLHLWSFRQTQVHSCKDSAQDGLTFARANSPGSDWRES